MARIRPFNSAALALLKEQRTMSFTASSSFGLLIGFFLGVVQLVTTAH